ARVQFGRDDLGGAVRRPHPIFSLEGRASSKPLTDLGLDFQHFALQIFADLARSTALAHHILEVGEIIFRPGLAGIEGGKPFWGLLTYTQHAQNVGQPGLESESLPRDLNASQLVANCALASSNVAARPSVLTRPHAGRPTPKMLQTHSASGGA